MGKIVNPSFREDGWIPTRNRHKNSHFKKKSTIPFMDSVHIHQISSPLDSMKISGQKMTTLRTMNGYDETDKSIEVVKKIQPFSASLITSMLMASMKEVVSDKHHLDLDKLTIDHVPCAYYERVE